jgi:hypothetical protein
MRRALLRAFLAHPFLFFLFLFFHLVLVQKAPITAHRKGEEAVKWKAQLQGHLRLYLKLWQLG